jgi:hypothetical protein
VRVGRGHAMRVTWRVGLSVGSIRFAVDSDGSDQTWLPLPVRTVRNALRHDKGMTAIARKAVPMGKVRGKCGALPTLETAV